VALVLAFLVIVVNLLTDLTYALLDPRVSFRA
jgi:ABC-type dipeptide/oligopeptide/nickel transport system permease component